MKTRSIILLAGLALATPVAAQPADPGEAAYQAGRKAYDLREWDKAIESFKEAYRLRSDAASLFNIAQSYRLKGDCVEAIGFYKTFKRNFPTAPNIGAVDKFITELEPCAKEKAATQPKTVPTTTTTATTTTTQPMTTTTEPTPLPDEDRGKGKRTAGLVLGGTGVLLVGTGFAFGMLANNKANEITDGGNPSMPPEFDPSLEDSGKRYDLLAKIAWGVGGAAVIGGVVLYVMGNSAKETRVSVAPMHGGALFAFGHSF